jgi:hypothetical protein
VIDGVEGAVVAEADEQGPDGRIEKSRGCAGRPYRGRDDVDHGLTGVEWTTTAPVQPRKLAVGAKSAETGIPRTEDLRDGGDGRLTIGGP